MIRLALWFLPEIGNVAKALGVCLMGLLFMTAITVGTNVQPWSQWWIAGNVTQTTDSGTSGETLFSLPSQILVSDKLRFEWARAAGFTDEQAVTMTAISLAENGTGNLAALSSTRDIGLWQINEVWWARFGGQDALTNPIRNAQAAKYVFDQQGMCAWYTYDASCGANHTSAYKMYMERARLAAAVQQPHGPLQNDDMALTQAMRPWMGVRYLFGGCTQSGVDCSCFTQAVLAKLGVALPRTAEEQYYATRRVQSPQFGDLVFFEKTYVGPNITHVGFYVGDGMMVSAITPTVGRQSLNDPYWRSRLVGYGRPSYPQVGNQA